MIKVIKSKEDILESIRFNDKFDAIVIDYESKDGIAIFRENSNLDFLKSFTPYKFYLFNDGKMVSGVKLDENEYFIEEIKKEEFTTSKDETLFIDPKEITKVLGHQNEKKLHIRKGIVNEVEKIQFIGLEG